MCIKREVTCRGKYLNSGQLIEFILTECLRRNRVNLTEFLHVPFSNRSRGSFTLLRMIDHDMVWRLGALKKLQISRNLSRVNMLKEGGSFESGTK